ncbi:hypothetical protein FRB90_003348, partial [Tulasnella sp. 427]
YDLIVMLGSWSPLFCKIYFFILGGCGLALLFAVEGTLQLRIFVMYHSSIKVLIFNGVFFVLEMACMISMFLADTIRFHAMQTPPGLKGCYATSNEVKYSKAMWWICLAFETYLSLFVIRVAVSHIRAYGAGSRILYVLIRDSLVWFVLLALCLLWNAVAWTAAPVGLSVVGIPALHASATIGGCRMLLNLRAAYFESLQPRDINATAATLPVTDASIGQFRSFQLSSDKLGKRGAAVDQALRGDAGILPNGRYSTGMDSWTGTNNDQVILRAPASSRQIAPPLPPLDLSLCSDEIELQVVDREEKVLRSFRGPSANYSRVATDTPNEPAFPRLPTWNWEATSSLSENSSRGARTQIDGVQPGPSSRP